MSISKIIFSTNDRGIQEGDRHCILQLESSVLNRLANRRNRNWREVQGVMECPQSTVWQGQDS
jgi:hypothetical protein